ncbi:MAG: hypothetical protein KatS3mg110_1463 [Pirellulaceae bacterium]|nr:MAG: hypothetical protein KatS3mg110_1463 [Pirellulaceae bacterium]
MVPLEPAHAKPSIFPTLYCAIAAAFGLALCLGVSAADVKGDLLSRYESGSQLLRSGYSRCTITAVYRRENWPAYKETEGKRTARLIVRRKDSFVRVDEALLQENDGQPVESRCTVLCIGPKLAFRADRQMPQSAFELSRIYSSTENLPGRIYSEFRIIAGALAIQGIPVADFIRDPSIHVTDVQELMSDGERIVQVNWADAPGSEFRSQGWIRLMPDRHWAIREWAVWERGKLPTAADYRASRGQVDYEGEHNGVPIMKRYRWWIEEGPEKKVSMSETTEVESIQFGTIPDTEFTPAALGIATPREVHNGYWFLALFAGGVLCLLIAVYLARTIRSRT